MIRGRRMMADLDQEIRDHIEAETQFNMDRGMCREEASRLAVRKFGNTTRVREETYDVWYNVWFTQFFQDCRYGLRTLRRNPLFSTVVVLTLALAVGMNTALFSVVNTVLLRPVSLPDGDRLDFIGVGDRDYRVEHDTLISRPHILTWEKRQHSYEAIAAYNSKDLALMTRNGSSQEHIASVTGDFWTITGAKAMMGRLFKPGQRHAIVLSYALFEQRFHGDPHAIGEAVTLDGYPFTITGVLPEGFRFRLPQLVPPGEESREMDAYISVPDALMRAPAMRAVEWDAAEAQWGPAPYSLYVIARRRQDVTFDHARAETESIFDSIALDDSEPPVFRQRVRVWTLQQKVTGAARRPLLVLFAAAGFVLLIAIANIANLLVARAAARQREIAVRASLGAGRMRVIRQFLTESLLFALLGGSAGLLLAYAGTGLMIRLWSQALPRLAETRLDSSVLLFTFALSSLSGTLFGLVPAIHLWRGDLNGALKDNSLTATSSRSRLRFRRALVATQVALALVLLIGAGLMVKSFWRMTVGPPGFDPEGILTLQVSLTGPQYTAWSAQDAYLHEALGRIKATPGVEAVGIGGTMLHTTVKVQGLHPRGADNSFATIHAVSAGYLRAMGVPLIAGNWLTDKQMLDGVLVNESFAREFGPNNLVGRRINGSFLNGTIAGVVADFKYSSLDAESDPEVYTSYELAPLEDPMTARLYVRMASHFKPNANAIRKLVSKIDPTQPVFDVQTLEHALSNSIAPRRFNLFLMAIFATAALMLAIIGMYGIVTYIVAQRTQEIGIRMAVGAVRRDILGMVVLQGIRPLAMGIVAGLVAASGLTRIMANLLYNLSPGDPETFAVAALVLSGTALLACLGPAFRAARMDPLVSLRHE